MGNSPGVWWFGGFQSMGLPHVIHFNRIFHYKPTIFGYPHLWKPSFWTKKMMDLPPLKKKNKKNSRIRSKDCAWFRILKNLLAVYVCIYGQQYDVALSENCQFEWESLEVWTHGIMEIKQSHVSYLLWASQTCPIYRSPNITKLVNDPHWTIPNNHWSAHCLGDWDGSTRIHFDDTK